MHKSISKRLLAGLLSVVMVLSLFAAVPANNAQAAATVKINSYTSVKAGNTVNYTIKNLTKNQYAKVSVTGTAKEGITVKKGTTTVKSTTKINGTGKNIVLKVKNYGVPGKKYALTVKVYNKKTNKLVKTVNTKTASIYKLTTTVAITPNKVDEMEVGGTVVLTATKAPANSTQAITWSTSDKAVATVDGGIVTAVAAGTATITATSGKKSASVVINVKAEEKPEEPIEENKGELPEITSVKAAKVDTIEVTFASAVTAKDVAFTVTRGTTNVTFAAPVWNEDKTVATLVTDAKLVNGTHEVTAKSAALDKAVTGKMEVESQRVEEIVILNTTALTVKTTPAGGGAAADAMGAVVYYDVLDQYGESIRSTTSIKWTTSCGDPKEKDVSTGRLLLKRTDDKAFTYGEQIYITGVYEKTGKSVNVNVTVGMAQALNTVEIYGFVKANTSTIVDSLPADFKAGEYVMVYKTLDQNGNPLGEYTGAKKGYIEEGDVIFLSDNPMLVDSTIEDATNNVVIGGEVYCAAKITPGLKVSDGGEVNITAIAGKTGNRVTKNFTVGQDVQLTSFTMSNPTSIIADGESVVIPFTALDQNGNAITNFRTLAKNETFNKLSFSVGVQGATVTLSEKNDGTAKLVFTDKPIGWDESVATDGQERPAIVTAIVVNGTGSNVQFGISDKARPEGITGADFDLLINDYAYKTTNLEGVDVEIGLDDLAYVDQYGRPMDALNYTDTAAAFFAASAADQLKNNEFAGYEFVVKAEYSGDGFTNAGVALGKDNYIKTGTPLQFTTSKKVINTAKTNDMIKFSIVKTKDDTSYEGVSPIKNVAFTTVDVRQLTNWNLDDFSTLHVVTTASNYSTLAQADKDGCATKLSETAPVYINAGITNGAANNVYVTVTAKYGNENVDIPTDYLTVEAGKVAFDDGVLVAKSGAAAATGAALKWTDLYNAATTNGVRKTATDRVTVIANNIYDDNGTVLGAKVPVATNSRNLTISDAPSVATTLVVRDAITLRPGTTAISNINRIKASYEYAWIVRGFDQYDALITDNNAFTFEVKNYVENVDGEVEANHTITGNGTSNVNITGAERGDTFNLEVSLLQDNKIVATKTIKVTVGSDTSSKMDQNVNYYLRDLKPALEAQRITQ